MSEKAPYKTYEIDAGHNVELMVNAKEGFGGSGEKMPGAGLEEDAEKAHHVAHAMKDDYEAGLVGDRQIRDANRPSRPRAEVAGPNGERTGQFLASGNHLSEKQKQSIALNSILSFKRAYREAARKGEQYDNAKRSAPGTGMTPDELLVARERLEASPRRRAA